MNPVKLSPSVWKIAANSNIYVLLLEEPIVIDTCDRDYHDEVREALSEIVDIEDVKTVLFTHMHGDHLGNFDLFPNAEFYASSESIRDFKKDPLNTVLKEDIVALLKEKNIEFKPHPKMPGLKFIHTPGHTRGSTCIYFEKERIMFTGDTIFGGNSVGRTDLPTSVPNQLHNSLIKITKSKYNYRILAPGHDY